MLIKLRRTLIADDFQPVNTTDEVHATITMARRQSPGPDEKQNFAASGSHQACAVIAVAMIALPVRAAQAAAGCTGSNELMRLRVSQFPAATVGPVRNLPAGRD